jgi:hypothetical protein
VPVLITGPANDQLADLAAAAYISHTSATTSYGAASISPFHAGEMR